MRTTSGIGSGPPNAERRRSPLDVRKTDAEGSIARLTRWGSSFYRRLGSKLGNASRGLGAAVLRGRPLRVNALAQHGTKAFQSSAYIRLWAPLTSPAASGQVEFALVRDDENFERAASGDVCIVQRTAVESEAEADRLIARLKAAGTRLIVDNDDAFSAIGPDHREFDSYSSKILALDRLLGEADQAWLSSAPLLDLYAAQCRAAHLVPNALDPRLWGRESPRSRLFSSPGGLQIVYFGTTTHDADFGLVLPALDSLAAGSLDFTLTVIGALRSPPDRKWLKVLAPPKDCRPYPRFVPWLRQQGPFDIGIVPLIDTPFNRGKSDIKFLDYSALGLVSVVSNVLPYSSNPRIGELAIMAENTSEGWLAALHSIRGNEPSLTSLAAAARAYLWAERSVDRVAEQQVRLLRGER